MPVSIPCWAKVCKVVSVAICLLAFGIMLALCAPAYRLYPSNTELPLSRVDAVAIGKNGQVYTYSRWTHRVQVYSSEGLFVCGWSAIIDTFRITPEGTIRAKCGQNVRTFSPTGELLSTERYDRNVHYSEFYPVQDPKVTKAGGTTYRVMPWSAIWPRVEKVSPGGEREVVISQPASMWLIQVPVPVFFYFLCGIGLYWTWYFAKRRYNKRFAFEASNRSG